MNQAKLTVKVLKALIQQEEEHIEALNAQLKTLSSRDSMSQPESEKV